MNEAGKLWVTDAELIRILGVPEDVGREALKKLDANPRSKFPRRDLVWGNRRYLPAVIRRFEEDHGMVPKGAARLIPEHLDSARLPRPLPPRSAMERQQ